MRQDAKRLIKITATILFFITIVGYGFFRSYNIIFGIEIKNLVIDRSGSNLAVSGNANNAIDLRINGRSVPVDQAGEFNENLVLTVGYNVINIEAEDKFGNRDELNYYLTQ